MRAATIRKVLRESTGLTDKAKKARCGVFAAVILAEWSALARAELNTSKSAYLSSLRVRELTSKGFFVGLPAGKGTAVLALMVELGMGPSGIGSQGRYDMRKFMLKGSTSHVKRNKNGGLYLNVPFGHKKKEVSVYSKGVAKELSKLAPTFAGPSGKMIWGERFPAGKVAKIKSHHVTDPLAGAVRLASPYKTKSGKKGMRTSGYKTWRTMSYNNRDPQSWISKGIKARRYIDVISRRIPELYERTFKVSS